MNNTLSDFIFQSKYSKYIPELGRKETWEESVNRIANMHLKHLHDGYEASLKNSQFNIDFDEAFLDYRDKKLLGSQRGLQFGGEPVLKKNCRLFNCSFTYVDRLDVFKEIEWVLLCGCGVGISVERQHVDKLPKMRDCLSSEVYDYVIDDSIEGWASAINALIGYYFNNFKFPKFDFSHIRPNGSYISGGFIAPGPEGLKKALTKIQELLDTIYNTTRKLSPLNCTDIISYCADSVLSGGVRRSALIVLFDKDDSEMFNCKTGNWFYDNPQRARFNMSAALDRKTTSKKEFERIFSATRQYGEPGFYWRSDDGVGPNPCCEIGFKPVLNGETGFQFCNLVTINGASVESEDEFYHLCKSAATIATIQASYNKFPFLGKVTEDLMKADPLIGVSIGGIMCNPSLLLSEEVLHKGAKIVREQNAFIAKCLGINTSSRCTCIKPDGNSSVLLGMTPGCHGEHAEHYIRRVQVNKEEEAGKIYKKHNPKAVVESVWSNGGTDWCVMFPITAIPGSIYKEDLYGIKQLEVVKTLFNSWILPGMADPISPIQNNVSNTVQVQEGHWQEVIDYVYDNRFKLAGVSFLPASADSDFNQPPYTKVLMSNQLLEVYGNGIVFASGLIVDTVNVFGDLWKACDVILGKGEKLYTSYEDAQDFLEEYNQAKPDDFLDKPYKEFVKANNEQYNRWIDLYVEMGVDEDLAEEMVDNDIEIPVTMIQSYLDKKMLGKVPKISEKREIIRRINKFANKYFQGDINLTIQALKQVQLLHDWFDISNSGEEIDWTKVKWKKVLTRADETGAQSCNGGSCEIKRL